MLTEITNCIKKCILCLKQKSNGMLKQVILLSPIDIPSNYSKMIQNVCD